MNRSGKILEKSSPFKLVDEMLKGSVRALSRLITLIEDETPGSSEVLKRIYYHSGNAYVVGLTGAPGTGKSTLMDHVAIELKRQGFKIGIIAIDPSSPFTGGAFLGDRLRMTETLNEDDIYIRSMSTRGNLGGLSVATKNVIKILDAFGKDFILIETVGTGQAEVDVMKETETTIVVSVPGLGDEIQIMKAGVMEIGDIFVVNKADKNGADRLVEEIETIFRMGFRSEEWVPPIMKTVATKREGVTALVEKILNHREYLIGKGLLRTKRMNRIQQEILEMVNAKIINEIIIPIREPYIVSEKLLDDIVLRRKDPYSVTEEIVDNFIEAFQRSPKGVNQIGK